MHCLDKSTMFISEKNHKRDLAKYFRNKGAVARSRKLKKRLKRSASKKKRSTSKVKRWNSETAVKVEVISHRQSNRRREAAGLYRNAALTIQAFWFKHRINSRIHHRNVSLSIAHLNSEVFELHRFVMSSFAHLVDCKNLVSQLHHFTRRHIDIANQLQNTSRATRSDLYFLNDTLQLISEIQDRLKGLISTRESHQEQSWEEKVNAAQAKMIRNYEKILTHQENIIIDLNSQITRERASRSGGNSRDHEEEAWRVWEQQAPMQPLPGYTTPPPLPTRTSPPKIKRSANNFRYCDL